MGLVASPSARQEPDSTEPHSPRNHTEQHGQDHQRRPAVFLARRV